MPRAAPVTIAALSFSPRTTSSPLCRPRYAGWPPLSCQIFRFSAPAKLTQAM